MPGNRELGMKATSPRDGDSRLAGWNEAWNLNTNLRDAPPMNKRPGPEDDQVKRFVEALCTRLRDNIYSW